MIKLLAIEGCHELWFTTCNTSFKYLLLDTSKGLKQPIYRSKIIGDHFKKWLNKSTIDHARAVMHGLLYAGKKFKA